MDRPTRPPSIDPGHETKRAILGGVGIVLLVVGVPLVLIGGYRFLSIFLQPALMDDGPGRPASGMIMIMIGAVLSMIGLQLTIAANLGRIARYHVGETLPVAHDAARESMPVVTEMAHAVSRGLFDPEQTLAGPRVRHACGATNDPDDRFCKGCGVALAPRLCPSCQARNDADARFCANCGAGL